ncbi:MAG: hypothetical protein JXI43_13360 [Tissierellales bacterium]|jgi:hypothetical protein|nr:hypothetical protein [Tissierellales bacterium]
MTLIYRLIILLLVTVFIKMLYSEKNIQNQINISLVLIPLVMRLLMIK